MRHPGETVLALYAGTELGWWARLRVARHLSQCGACAREVEEYQQARQVVEEAAGEMPPGVHWNALAAEMTANIRLGLAAGRIVGEPEPERVHIGWRRPALALPLLLVVLAGWILQSVPPAARLRAPVEPASAALVLEGGETGIGVEQDGRGFRLLHPRAEKVVYTVRGDAVRSRYVDTETGQMTISHVYAE